MNCKQDNSDHTIKQSGKKVSILLVYVEDMVIIGNDKDKITRLKKKLSEEFISKILESIGTWL